MLPTSTAVRHASTKWPHWPAFVRCSGHVTHSRPCPGMTVPTGSRIEALPYSTTRSLNTPPLIGTFGIRCGQNSIQLHWLCGGDAFQFSRKFPTCGQCGCDLIVFHLSPKLHPLMLTDNCVTGSIYKFCCSVLITPKRFNKNSIMLPIFS